jgi:cold shock CspA family protein
MPLRLDNSTIPKSGVVRFWDDRRGFGFIECGNKTTLFFHASNVLHGYGPTKGDLVFFVESAGRDGRPCAKQIEILNADNR